MIDLYLNSNADYNEDEYYGEDELNTVDINLIKRQLEIADLVLKEYDAFYQKFHKLCNDAFIYAPDTLDWATGSSMSSVIGTIEEETAYLRDWRSGMKEYCRVRSKIEGGEFSGS